MEKYTAYKPSGIKWIGDIPEHWSSEQLRKYLRLISIKNKPNEQLLSVTREQGVIIRNIESKEENHNFIPEDLSGYKYVRKGQFAINKMKSWQGSYGVSNFDGIVSPAYFVCELNNIYEEFFSWAIRSKAYVGFFTQMSKGIRVDQWDLSPIALKQIPFFEPPLSEQHSIVAFLEKATANIDAYIKQTEQEINKLNELKQAEIANVVTKGLNPNASMKDSGISWIGEIPEHWECLKIRYLFKEKSQKGFPNEPILSATQKYGVIPQDLYENRVVVVNKGLEGLKLVEVGDFVISLRSFQGGIEYAYYRGIISAAYTILRPSNTVNSNFIKFLFKSLPFIELLQTCVTGIREGQNINYDILRNNYLMLPPIEEQQQIVDYIESKTSKIEEYITALKSETEHMQEYKQRLISDVVTGKMKV